MEKDIQAGNGTNILDKMIVKMEKKYSMLKRAIEKGDIKEKIVCFWLIQLHYSNHTLQALEVRNKMYSKIEKKYKKHLRHFRYEDIAGKERANTIWVCWLQGLETAPEIVRICINSIYKYRGDKEVIVISKENYMQYVSIPSIILKKWEEGKIGNAHFADFLRLELLIKYGGIWMDSTVYLTDYLPEYITNTNLFLYENANPFDTRNNCENWIISACSNNRILKLIRDMLLIYWKRENKCREYFIWNLFANMVFEKYPEDWIEITKIPANICYLLNRNLNNIFSREYWENITYLTSVHKLSYKQIMESKENTYYYYIKGEGKEQ